MKCCFKIKKYIYFSHFLKKKIDYNLIKKKEKEKEKNYSLTPK